ncbi:gamma-glutamylcyclotransferase [Winogradskya consettensis]|uniref:Gamma-glutamylcyclotransferase n=1 Tax=Winogradskya consettensis TaxID=113560 RepID=A0A919VVN1_9ACTN|nr:gamma-glutamylcyclotransferase [Actinoplanes consettensis]
MRRNYADTLASYSPSLPDGAMVIAVGHYAAYGSNLDPARMRAYCPHSPMVGVGWVEGWRLTFAGEGDMGWEGAVTTIVESPGDRVFVSLYDVHPWDASQLDEVEGVAAGAYQKVTVRVSTLEGDLSAWVYVFHGYEGGMPTAWYLSEIANAAEKAGAPDDYVHDLRQRPTRTQAPEV